MGNLSNRWSVYPLEKESQNGTALKYNSSQVGVSPVLNTENTQSELSGRWIDQCQWKCIDQTTTEPHSPQENCTGPKIGQIGSMVREVIRSFDVSLK